jgi:CRP-like cAMP-binding protein
LDGIELFSALTGDEIRRLEQRCKWRHFRRGEQVLDRDSESRDIMFVVKGTVRIVNYSSTGREVAYATMAAGGYFGELSALDGQPRSATVVAVEECLLASLSPDVFEEFLLSHAQAAVQVSRRLAAIIRSCDDRIMDLSTLGAMQRVYGFVMRLAEPDPVNPAVYSIYPIPTQHAIAGQVSTTRETVARALSNLNAAGIAERKGKTLYIRDRNGLESLIERLGEQGDSLAR